MSKPWTLNSSDAEFYHLKFTAIQYSHVKEAVENFQEKITYIHTISTYFPKYTS